MSVAVAVVTYVSLDTFVTGEAVGRLLSPTLGLAKLVLIASRGIELTTLLVFFEWAFLAIWSRRIVGRWAYYSESGNFGLAEIKVVQGDFEYHVELYRTAGQVAAAMEGEGEVAPFAHARSQICRYAGDQFYTDYHIEYTDKNYAPRKGLLTLVHTANAEVMTGHWNTMLEEATMRSGKLDFLRKHTFIRKYLVSPQQSSPVADTPR